MGATLLTMFRRFPERLAYDLRPRPQLSAGTMESMRSRRTLSESDFDNAVFPVSDEGQLNTPINFSREQKRTLSPSLHESTVQLTSAYCTC